MPQLPLLSLVPQRVLNSIVAALLLLTAPVLSPASTPPAPQAHVVLDGSVTAAQLTSQLPRTLRFADRMGTAVFATLPAPLPVQGPSVANGYHAGDVAYVASEQAIVVFLTDGTAVPDHGLTLLGRVTEGLDDLARCIRDCHIEIVAAPAG